MIDAVLSYHLNPDTCGVARFNQLLAKKLGVPCVGFHEIDEHAMDYPLISVKPEECAGGWPTLPQSHDLFLHGVPCVGTYMGRPQRVYAANRVIANQIRHCRPDVIEAFCPSTIRGDPTRAPLNVLCFGMAHKLQLLYYEKLKALLDGSGQDYTVSVSTAVHEGSPWDAVSEAGEKLRAIFKEKTRVLGYLADDALAKELQDCAAVAMFFDPALRANNTTFWAARDQHKVIVTNVDADSPDDAIPPVFDINAITAWPQPVTTRRWHPYTWDNLFQTMGVAAAV